MQKCSAALHMLMHACTSPCGPGVDPSIGDKPPCHASNQVFREGHRTHADAAQCAGVGVVPFGRPLFG
jgi:hypothetical protein